MRYLGRAVRYLLRTIVLIGLLLAVLYFANYTKPQFWQVFSDWRGITFVVVLVGWSFIYAKTGFVSYTIRLSMAAQHSKIVETMAQGDYILSGEELGIMRFKPRSVLRRITMAGDDTITLTAIGTEAVEVEGARSVVSKIELRLRRMAADEE